MKFLNTYAFLIIYVIYISLNSQTVEQFNSTDNTVKVFLHYAVKKVKERKLDLYRAHCEKLTSEALRFGSHSCYTANSPYPPLPRSIHQMALPV